MHITDLYGRRLSVIALDYETFFEQGKGAKFTLSKMTTTEYVRSPKFRVHGASLRFPGDKKAWWVSHCELRDVLREVDWSQSALLCHNTAFDGFILSQQYGHVPAYYLDTLSMSRGEFGVHVPHSLGQVGQRLGKGNKLEGELAKTANIYKLPWEIEKPFIAYGNQDVDLTWDVFREMYYERNYPEKELHIIDLTLRAFCDPKLHIDVDLCVEEAQEEAANKSKLVALSGVSATQLSSNQQFAELLRARGVTPPVKTSSTTGKETYALAKGDLEFQALAHDKRVADIVRARLAVKSTINETRAYRFLSHGRPTLPVPLQYCGAHTHRWSAWDKINMQNLPSGRKGQSDRLRRAIIAPPGYVIVVVDSSQIEARTNAWAAGEHTLLDSFRTGGDPYAETASDVYGFEVLKKQHKEERQVGKVLELGAGYGMGWRKFAFTVRSGAMGPPVDVSDELAQKAIQTYRNKRAAIPKMWNELDSALIKMVNGERFTVGPWEFFGTSVMMPNGLFIHYPDLMGEEGAYGFDSFSYRSRNGWTPLYGGKFCLAKGTQVLTERGWLAIESVTPDLKIWDGDAWVSQQGAICNGFKEVISLCGILLTPDHKVLTTEGWINASQSEGYNRAESRLPDSGEVCWERWEEIPMADALQMRKTVHNVRSRSGKAKVERYSSFMRLHEETDDRGEEYHSRYVENSTIRNLAFYVRPLSTTLASGVEKLRRSWNRCLQRMANFRGFFSRYAGDVFFGLNFRPQEQLSGVYTSELQMGDSQSSKQESPDFFTRCGYTENIRDERNKSLNAILPLSPRKTGRRSAEVYDLINCGPRNRFVVRDENKQPLIVHNCENLIQSTARTIVAFQALEIAKRYPDIVLLVHDEVVYLAPEDEADEAYQFGLECLRRPPPFCADLPVDAEGGYAHNYSK